MDRPVSTLVSQPRASVLAGLEATCGIWRSGKLVELARGGQACSRRGIRAQKRVAMRFGLDGIDMPAVPRGGGNVAPGGRQGGTNVVNTCSSCANSDRTSSHIGFTRIGHHGHSTAISSGRNVSHPGQVWSATSKVTQS